MVPAMREDGLMIRGMVLVSILTRMVICTKGTGTNIKGMGREHTHTPTVERNIKVKHEPHKLWLSYNVLLTVVL